MVDSQPGELIFLLFQCLQPLLSELIGPNLSHFPKVIKNKNLVTNQNHFKKKNIGKLL